MRYTVVVVSDALHDGNNHRALRFTEIIALVLLTKIGAHHNNCCHQKYKSNQV